MKTKDNKSWWSVKKTFPISPKIKKKKCMKLKQIIKQIDYLHFCYLDCTFQIKYFLESKPSKYTIYCLLSLFLQKRSHAQLFCLWILFINYYAPYINDILFLANKYSGFVKVLELASMKLRSFELNLLFIIIKFSKQRKQNFSVT